MRGWVGLDWMGWAWLLKIWGWVKAKTWVDAGRLLEFRGDGAGTRTMKDDHPDLFSEAR